MSDKLPTIIQDAESDFTEKDLAIIQKYVEDGLPDIAVVDGEKLTRIMDLYLSGKSYRAISTIMNVKAATILYLSHKYNWFQLKKDYITDLENTIRGRLLEARLVNQDFLLQLVHMWQKKIGSKMTKYLSTDNEAFANSIDLKEIDKYLKTVDMLHRLSSEKNVSQAAPAVGLNLGDGVTIVKKGDNEVEITPKSKVISEMLKEYANSRREEEKKK